MKRRFTRSVLAAAVVALPMTGLAIAQDAGVDMTPGTPRFVTLLPKPGSNLRQPAAVLQTWNGSFTYNGHNYTYNMVGTDPSTGSSTTVPVILVPLKIVITTSTGTVTFDPAQVLTNGNTVTQNTVQSPLFDSTTAYVQGGVNVGTTQYIDAYQRANFWGTVQSHTGYHVLLGAPRITAEVTLKPSSRYGKTGTPFGFTAAEVNINYIDAAIQKIMAKITAIQPNVVPIFLSYNTYLTDFGCCIGGYHSASGAQSYMWATYVDVPGQFAQDVSALSHELGEWADDPLVNNINGNQTPCGILENGDPLENNPNFGGYPYTLHGFQYNLQDLVTLPYFGAPPSTSVNGFFTFQGQTLSVCQNGS